MGLSEQRSWKDKDHIAFFKKEELLMMSHYSKEFYIHTFLLRKTPQLSSDYCGKHLSYSTFTHLSISTCLHTRA